MANSKFELKGGDWSEFVWPVIIDGYPTPEEMIGHELTNEFSSEIYLTKEGDLWSNERSEEEIGPNEIVDAYQDLFRKQKNLEDAKEIFEQAAEDQDIPQNPRECVQRALKMYEGMVNYKNILQDNHSFEDKVNYGFLIDPIADEPYVSIEEENIEDLKQGKKQVRSGESVFFFLNTINKNFHEYVYDEVESPELNIEANMEDERLVLDIYDNGPGLQDRKPEHIFNPNREDPTGLPTAKYILEKYDGELNYSDSHEGFGLEAKFNLTD